MAEYQNIFTRVQVHAPAYAGVPLGRGTWVRQGKPFMAYWLGKIGDAQIGPIYLGFTGVISLVFGFIAIEIIGLNMMASVNWNPIQFVRQLPWLALEPPPPAYGGHAHSAWARTSPGHLRRRSGSTWCSASYVRY